MGEGLRVSLWSIHLEIRITTILIAFVSNLNSKRILLRNLSAGGFPSPSKYAGNVMKEGMVNRPLDGTPYLSNSSCYSFFRRIFGSPSVAFLSLVCPTDRDLAKKF